MRPRLVARDVGPSIVVALVLALGVLWAVLRPADVALSNYVGQFLGAKSILLLSIALVLISTLPWVAVWFDGIHRAAIWHRRAAILGLVLLVPHILLSSGTASGVGGAMAIVGATGLFALAAWAILPRWQSVVPRHAHRRHEPGRPVDPGAGAREYFDWR